MVESFLDYVRSTYCPGWDCSMMWCHALLCLGLCSKKSDSYSSIELPTTAFPWSEYGCGCHDILNLTVDDILKIKNYAGPYIRTDVPFWEIGEQNFTRADQFIELVTKAQGIPVIVVRGWTDTLGVDKSDIKMTANMSREVRDEACLNLSYRLADRYRDKNVIFEGWNEPDHDSTTEGFHVSTGEDRWSALVSHLIAFGKGIRKANGITAFAPFMTLNETKCDRVEDVWRQTHEYFDYFSFHYYDDDVDKIYYYCKKFGDIVGSRSTICTEYGSQDTKDLTYYRKAAYAIKKGFTNFKSVILYVYDVNDDTSHKEKWEMRDRDLLWNVTHDSKP